MFINFKKQNTCLDKLFFKIIFLFWFYKKIVNLIYIMLIKFNSNLIKNENSFVITNKLKMNRFYYNINSKIIIKS